MIAFYTSSGDQSPPNPLLFFFRKQQKKVAVEQSLTHKKLTQISTFLSGCTGKKCSASFFPDPQFLTVSTPSAPKDSNGKCPNSFRRNDADAKRLDGREAVKTHRFLGRGLGGLGHSPTSRKCRHFEKMYYTSIACRVLT
jgi:hypothetical protein